MYAVQSDKLLADTRKQVQAARVEIRELIGCRLIGLQCPGP